MPYRAENNDIIINYLVNERRIDKKIVNYCIEKGIVYQSYKDNSVVFAGYDENDIARFATTRSTNNAKKKEIDNIIIFCSIRHSKLINLFRNLINFFWRMII